MHCPRGRNEHAPPLPPARPAGRRRRRCTLFKGEGRQLPSASHLTHSPLVGNISDGLA